MFCFAVKITPELRTLFHTFGVPNKPKVVFFASPCHCQFFRVVWVLKGFVNAFIWRSDKSKCTSLSLFGFWISRAQSPVWRRYENFLPLVWWFRSSRHFFQLLAVSSTLNTMLQVTHMHVKVIKSKWFAKNLIWSSFCLISFTRLSPLWAGFDKMLPTKLKENLWLVFRCNALLSDVF